MLHYYTKIFVTTRYKYNIRNITTHNVTYASLIYIKMAPREHDHSTTFSLPLPLPCVTCEPEQNKELDET
jgi:hypothetical protein